MSQACDKRLDQSFRYPHENLVFRIYQKMANSTGHGGPRPGSGRKRWEPTDRDRRQVEAMVGYGIPVEKIANLLNVDADTLAKHCKREIDTGHTKVAAQMGQLLVTSILARQPLGEDAVPIINDEKMRATLLMFYMKTRLGYKTTEVHELQGNKDHPLEINLQDDENRSWVSAQLDRLDKAQRFTREVAGQTTNGKDKSA
jgi:hypothetical protein